MHMIGHAVYRFEVTAQVARDPSDERIEAGLDFGSDQLRTALGAEQGMIEVLCPGARHNNLVHPPGGKE